MTGLGKRALGIVGVVAAGAAIWLVLFTAFGDHSSHAGNDARRIEDSFDRLATSRLGTADRGGTWDAVAGTWGVLENKAVVRSSPSDGPAIALVDPGSSTVEVRATMAEPVDGWGLVFRYRDPTHYWAVVSTGADGRLQLLVVDGKRVTPVGAPSDAAAQAGATVAVLSEPGAVRVSLDGKVVLSADDDRFDQATPVGLVQFGAERRAAWDDFRAGNPELPVVTVPQQPGATR